MIQQVKSPAAKPDNLSSIPGNHMVEERTDSHMYRDMHVSPCTHMYLHSKLSK